MARHVPFYFGERALFILEGVGGPQGGSLKSTLVCNREWVAGQAREYFPVVVPFFFPWRTPGHCKSTQRRGTAMQGSIWTAFFKS